jgi:DNA-binding SARP family transcriptional activator
VEFRVLGPLEVVGDRGALLLGGGHQRLVLALLLVRAPGPLSLDRLIDELWGERPPATAQHAVQVYVSALRKVLRSGGGEAAVRTSPSGYAIDVEPERVDARRFERLIDEAQRGLSEDPPRARGLFEEALALWRGAPLAEFEQSELARSEADRLVELHTLALEGVVEARLECGEHGAVIGQITGLVAANPLRERPRRLLMLALYRDGRHAEALSAYRDACAALDEIGLQPSPELRELEQAILQHDASLRPSSSEAGAGAAPTTIDAGSRAVDGKPLGEEARVFPLPPRLRETPPGGFVGRASERERLGEFFREASEGHLRLALVSGEPGIGKTRLASHAALEARSEGAIVLYGRTEEELAIPYGPWLEALTCYVAHGPEAVLRAHVESQGGELARVVPGLKKRLADVPPPRETDPDTERYLLWGAVVELLREASSGEPVVLVLDDLQWADKSTLQLLKHLVSHGQGLRALIIATYRESDLARGHPLSDALADLHREQGVERFALKGLDEQDIVEIMEQAAGHKLDEAGRGLAKELLHETDGNPFYTGELLRHLRESGAVYREDGGRWAVRGALADLGLPESIREVVGRRVERLGEETREVLSVSAVIGREFDVALLAGASERSEDELLGRLEEAVAASVLTESATVPGRFSFAHALINHTLYQDLGTTRRARLHRRVGEALEELLGAEPGAGVPALAHHWAAATTAVDLHKAVMYARMAGERALEELAPEEALRSFSQALELQAQGAEADLRERCDLLIGLGEAQRQTGDSAYRATLLEASRLASELEDADRAARAALANSRGHVSAFGQIDEERLAAMQRALELDDPPQPVRRTRLLGLQARELLYEHRPEHRRALADEALALARRAGDQRTLAEALLNAALAYWVPDTLDVRIDLVQEALDSAKAAKDPALEFWALWYAAAAHAESGLLERARTALEQGGLIATELGQPSLIWFARYIAAGWALMRGELARGEELAQEALQLGTDAGQPDAILIFATQLFSTRVYQGRGDEVATMVERSAAAYPLLEGWQAGLAWAYCWLGRQAQAAAIVEHAAGEGFDHVAWGPERALTLALYADATAQAGVTSAAMVLYELIEPWADQFVWDGIASFGHARMYLGLLADCLGWNECADEHLAFACEFHEANGLLLSAARSHLGWAEALARRGAAKQAQSHATRALELSREHGYGTIEARAAAIVDIGSLSGAAIKT